ncbi:MAG: hypothetical protein ACE5JR_00840 [Gemmatimonadota bacterium]
MRSCQPKRRLLPRTLHSAPTIRVATSLLLSAVSAGACDSEVVGPDDPARVILLGSAEPAAVAGEVSDSLLEVRVETSGGSPIPAVRVRFQPTQAGGFVDPPIASTDERGIARGSFVADVTAVTVRVRADLPDHPRVRAAVFRVRILPAGVMRVQIVSGDDQEIEVGTQVPRPLSVRVLPVDIDAVGGRPVVWELAQGTDGARLTADTVHTDELGDARVLVTVGREPGDHIVRAFVPEPYASDTALFQIRAVTELATSVRIDSVVPSSLVAGERARVYGSGLLFGPLPSGSEVFVDGVVARVLSGAPTVLEIEVPSFADRCLPPRRVGLRVLAGGVRPSNGVFVDLSPALDPIDLAAGETRLIEDLAQIRCLVFASPPTAREHFVAVQSASATEGGRTPLRLIVRSASSVSGEPIPASLALSERAADADVWPLVHGGADIETRLRASSLRELLRAGARPLRPPAGSPGRLGVVSGSRAAPGDTIRFAFAVDPATLEVSCTDTAAVVHGVVRSSGPRALLVEDADAPAGGFTDADWDFLSREIEEVTLPTDVVYFGEPADIDGNGQVIVLFTPQVNRLTPRGSGALIGGFFLALDLADSGDPEKSGLQDENGEGCPTSNEAEIVYLPVPDPEGDFSDPFRRDRALPNARVITAHEIQHLISAEQRLILGDAEFEQQETIWLAEGMSHIAEEVNGLAAVGASVGRNLTFDDFTDSRGSSDAFRAFHFTNFARLRLHMVSPATTPAIAATDPLGFESLQMRGFAWIFLRWLADRLPGADETAFFRRLSTGGSRYLAGIQNVEAATGRRWEELLAEFSIALAGDDLRGGAFPNGLQVGTWDLRRTFAQLQAEPGNRTLFPPEGYPLAVTELPVGSAFEFELGSSTSIYFLFAETVDADAVSLELASHGGGSPPETGRIQVMVGRAK